MPRIPIYERRAGIPAQGPAVRADTGLLSKVPQAVARGGAALSESAVQLGKQYEKLKEQDEFDRALEASVDFSRKWRAFTAEELAKKGEDTYGNIERAKKWIQETQGKYLEKAPSKETRTFLQNRFYYITNSTLNRMASLQAKERRTVHLGILDSLKEENVKTAYLNPDEAERVHGDLFGAYTGAVKAGILNEREAEELSRRSMAEVYGAALDGLIDRDPEKALEEFEAGKFNAFLSEKQLDAYADKIRVRAKTVQKQRRLTDAWNKAMDFPSYDLALEWAQDKENGPDLPFDERNTLITALKRDWGLRLAQDKEAKRQEQVKIQNAFLEKLHAGELTATEIQESSLEPFGLGSKDAFLKALDKRAEAALEDEEDPFKESDVEFYNEKLEAAYKGELEPDAVFDWIGKGLSSKDAEHVRKIATAAKKEALGQEEELLKLAVEAGKKMIVKGNIFSGFEQWTVKDAYLFEHALMGELAKEEDPEKRIKMLTPGTKDYVVDRVMIPFLKSPQEQISQRVDYYKSLIEPKDQGPAKRKPGESIEAYLKRTGGE